MPSANMLPQAGAPAIAKRFVQVGRHRIHYRVAGAGPAIVLLHDSPRSSRLHLDTMRQLAGRFRVFALDTPGYGNSSPIGIVEPTIADFGKLLGKTLRVLGLGQAPLYATHTSAKIALDHAANAAALPAILLLDGLSIPQHAPDEEFIAAYMRPFHCDADGAYLAAAWSRMQDMLHWFPWFDARPANRIAIDRPGAAWLDQYVLDLLSAGPHYADAYAAAMRYDPRPALRRVSCPTVVGACSDDVLFGCLDLVPGDRSRSVQIARLSSDRGEWLEWIADTFSRSAKAVPEPSADSIAVGPSYVDLPHGQMLVHRAGPASAVPLLILEASSTLHAHRWQAELADARATLVPELPGYGESDPLVVPASLDDHADALAAAMATLDIHAVDVLAIDAAAPLAMTLAVRHPVLVQRLVFDGIGAAAEAGTEHRLCPVITPDHAGGHLHRIWHMLRDGELQWPWHDGRISAQRRLEPSLDAQSLHRTLVDILKQPEHYGDVACAGIAQSSAGIGRPGQPALFFDVPGDTGYAGVAAAAACLADSRVVARPPDIASAALSLLDYLPLEAAMPAMAC